jgi:hypothetical protein
MEPVADRSLARSFPESLRAKCPHVFDGYRADFVASTVDGYVTQSLALGADLSRVAAPTVVLGGALDELFPPPEIDTAATFVPISSLGYSFLAWLTFPICRHSGRPPLVE